MSKAIRRRLAREAKKPIGRMKARKDLAGRIVNPCNLACFTCDRFIGNNRHTCTGVKAQPNADEKILPLCHVDFRTGRMESPLDYRTGELIPGQEKFYKTLRSGPWPAEKGCAWVAVKSVQPSAVSDQQRKKKREPLINESEIVIPVGPDVTVPADPALTERTTR